LEQESQIENKLNKLIENACRKHHITQPNVMAAGH
jgi:hypothetical protein